MVAWFVGVSGHLSSDLARVSKDRPFVWLWSAGSTPTDRLWRHQVSQIYLSIMSNILEYPFLDSELPSGPAALDL